ncbi:ABC transporter substrate-binding protein [Pseudoalteromonas sp. HL-AS1]|uniref:ABC transporter substrate-binding protein n=1 Tax=Pseudoalteromonas sp. HL-AS1 TaxID=3071081 RepID=UPI00281632B8|nr:ABC transporter substrate-binding protein [Pseudoalteromonas sp. HL-AS1]WMS91628.1 ABC transporter substrate-binding protein [Pseudoalteromonas sp. HL-AS1]
MRLHQLFLLFVLLIFAKPSLSKSVDIDVLVEDGYFPIIINAQKKQGFAPEFINILNDAQEEFNFILISLRVKRLTLSVEKNNFDVLFLMAMQWLPQASQENIENTEFYTITKNELYTLKENASEQTYFDNLDKLTKVGVLGYSYQFAGFNTNAEYLREEHQVSLTIDEFNVVKMLLLRRAEVGVLNSIAYQYFKKQNILNMDLLFKSDVPDAVYETHFLINSQSNKISSRKMDEILNLPTTQMQLQKLLDKYGIPSSYNNTALN